MSIPDGSYINSIASVASGMRAEDIQMQLGVAILKQIKDMEEIQSEMIAQLMESMPAVDPQVGTIVNTTA